MVQWIVEGSSSASGSMSPFDLEAVLEHADPAELGVAG